jgi:hypothetical protein
LGCGKLDSATRKRTGSPIAPGAAIPQQAFRHSPPTSPVLTRPCPLFYLFPEIKKHMKGRRFANADEVIAAAKTALKKVVKNGFQDAFKKLYDRWMKCVAAEGEYFEGNVV